MKQFLLSSFIFLPMISSSQITITENDMPNAGNTFINTNALIDLSIDVNATGANYNWDYSSVQPLYSTPDTFTDIGGLPVLLQIFFSFTSNLADKNGLNLDFNGFTIEDVYSVFKKSSAQLQLNGYAGTFDGIPLPIVYSQSDVIYRFPMNFSNQDSSDASVVFSVPGVAYVSQQRHRVNNVDGWGTIKTPIGSFNALRVKSSITDVDSVFVDTLGFGSNVTLKSYEYKWLAQGSGIPVFQLNSQDVLGTEVLSGVVYQDTAFFNGISSIPETSGVKVFPNPAGEFVHFSFNNNQPCSVFVYDESGHMVFEKKDSSSPLRFDVSQWQDGIYFVRSIQNENQFFSSFIIQH